MNSRFLFAGIASLAIFLPRAQTALGAPACNAKKQAEILAPAAAGGRAVKVNCSLKLKPTDVVTKSILIEGKEASGIVVDCNGATLNGGGGTINSGSDMIVVRPKKSGSSYLRPEKVTIKNCIIHGSARIWGINANATGDEIYRSSRTPGHVAYMKASAPRWINFVNITFYGQARNTLFFGPGVHYSSVNNSKFLGKSNGGAIYLEAESSHNTIRNNVFDIDTKTREILSVDGSSHNKIINNTFKRLDNGGIFLYRNCGEQGVIRHQTPSYNQIINNIFHFSGGGNKKTGIHVNSRNGGRYYCDYDRGFSFGSSANDNSLAARNVVAQNRLLGSASQDAIKISYHPNFLAMNEKVSSAPARKAGCYVKNGSPREFVLHGQKVQQFLVNGRKTCTGKQYSCNDGVLTESSLTCPARPIATNYCYIELNRKNRLVVRNENGSGLAYFDQDEMGKAQAELAKLIRNGTCDSDGSAPVVVDPPKTSKPKPKPRSSRYIPGHR